MSEYYPVLKKDLDCCIVLQDMRPMFFGDRFILLKDGTFGTDASDARRFKTRTEAKGFAMKIRTRDLQVLTILNEEAAEKYMEMAKVAPVQLSKKEDRSS